MSEYLNTSELCKEKNISRSTLQRWLNEGLPTANMRESVPSGKGNVFYIEEVEEWIKQNKIK
jgi:predicted site-specific integrase-resolvase